MSFIVCDGTDFRIVIDRKSRMIGFDRCHCQKSWLWPRRASEEFTCPLDDVIAVHLFRMAEHDSKATGAAVVTQHGRAILPLRVPGVQNIVDFLSEECKGRGSGPWRQNPNNETLLVYVLLLVGFGGFAIWVRWFSGWVAR